ncbi:putative cupin superfamily protein [Neorhizobium galegae]|uniref:cupin domain-containing protein n=1 Tax=Neorhizobium galegae TaxID=399 RepID=UPI001AE2EA57|nr:cupin domain-containing protein [Neorhizobium galegae]MBP2551575.1 putative cupin superfamily protein [Neorhizobium galegae]
MNRVELKIPGDHGGESEWHEITPGERFRIRTSVVETDGLYMTLEIIADPRNGVPMHVHANEEECFIVLEGSLHLVNGDQRLNLSAGDVATVKRGTPHAWCNISEKSVRILIVFAPGHMERTFRRIGSMKGKDLTAISQSAESDGSTIVGPPPFDDIYSVLSARPMP